MRGGRVVGEGTPRRPVALMGAIKWDHGGVEAIIEELLLHHKFLRRSCVEKKVSQVKKPGKPPRLGGLVTSAGGKTTTCQRGGWKRKSPLAWTGENLDPACYLMVPRLVY